MNCLDIFIFLPNAVSPNVKFPADLPICTYSTCKLFQTNISA